MCVCVCVCVCEREREREREREPNAFRIKGGEGYAMVVDLVMGWVLLVSEAKLSI